MHAPSIVGLVDLGESRAEVQKQLSTQLASKLARRRANGKKKKE